MKRITIIMAVLMAAMLWTGCQDTLEKKDPTSSEEKPVAVRDSVTLTIEAGKGVDTKALELVNGGQTLNAFWRSGEEVKVFATGSATAIGTLTATPKEDKTKATLSGSIDVSGLSAGQTLVLLFPSATWSYEGQSGRLLYDENHPAWPSVEKNFDFARAEVTITEVSATSIITSSTTTFLNQQSIYRFGFRYGSTSGPTIRSKIVQLTSDQGQLAKNGNVLTGEITCFAPGEALVADLQESLTSAEAEANTLLYFAIRNGNTTADDTFSFTIYDVDGATYKGDKLIPKEKLSSFVSAKTVALNRLELAQGATAVTTAL